VELLTSERQYESTTQYTRASQDGRENDVTAIIRATIVNDLRVNSNGSGGGGADFPFHPKSAPAHG
jgi:hypothetical protein